MKGWIDKCQLSHPACEMPQQVGGPKRLLQCLSDGSIRLIQTQSRTQRCGYIALSYCWGDGTAVMKTTENTLDPHQRGIPNESLPLLFQEVVALARGVEIPYLWIDSLCIIQDSEEDKEREMMQMSDIFRGALVVVVAAQAPSPSNSLLRVEPQSGQNTWRTASLIGYEEMGLDHFKFRKRAGRAHNYKIATKLTHTGQRAWCFQEKLLASRCLVFLEDEVVWECRSCCLCECGREQEDFSVGNEWDRGFSHTMEPYRKMLLPFAEHEPGTLKYFADAEAAYSFWKAAVMDYSERKLTYNTDRLPAISAVASIVAKATGDSYLAGLWRDDLLAGLGWLALNHLTVPRLDGSPDPVRRPKSHQKYMAPTWSWASRARRVGYRLNKTRHLRDADLDASVLDAWTTLEGQNPYGRVSDAAIVLSGLHCDAELTISGDGFRAQLDFGHGDVQTVGLGRWLIQALDFIPVEPDTSVEPDTNVDRLSGNSRYLRPTMDRQTMGYDYQPHCSGTVRLLRLEKEITLILTPSRRREGAYERLGIFHPELLRGEDKPVKMPKEVQRSSITLV